MEFFVVVFIALCVILFVRVSGLNSRLEHIERYLQEVTGDKVRGTATAVREEQGASAIPVDSMQGESIQPMYDLQASAAASVSMQSSEPDVFSQFGEWLRTDWLMKLGGFLVILGVGWFVSYAFAEGWIGPLGRIMTGLAVGAIVLTVGRYRIAAYVTQGSVLMFLGAAIVLMTTYAAREVYDMFTPLSALVLMFGTSCVLGVTSVVYRNQALAVANVLLAGVAPLLTNSPEPSIVGLMSYLLVLTVGSVWVTGITGWRRLPLFAFALVAVYGLPFLSGGVRGDLDMGLLFSFIFTAVFFAVSVIGMRIDRMVRAVDVATALAAATYLLVWVLGAAQPEWQSLLLIAWTVVFACGAFLAVHAGAHVAFFYTYAGVGTALLGVATALELDGATLTIAAIAEASLVLWLGYRVTGNAKSLPYLMLPWCIPLMLSVESIVDRAWRTSIFHEHSVVLLLIMAMASMFAVYFEQCRLNASEEDRRLLASMRTIAWAIAGSYGAIMVWLVAHALFGRDEGTFAALVIYTLTGSALFIIGRTGARWQRIVARILISFVVVRLLLVEVWGMSLAGRVVTSCVIGILFIIVAWLERNMARNRT